MRNREQFKAYVYAKADAAAAKRRKMRRLALGGVAAFCVCVCVGSAVLFSEMQNKASSDALTADMSAVATFAQAEGNAEVAYATSTEADKADDGFDYVFGASNEIAEETECANSAVAEDVADAPAAVKNYLFSVNACTPSYGLVSAAHCEVIENDAEKEESASSDNGTASVRVGISANFMSKPTVSDVTVDYSGEVITITVFADQTPSPFGAYLYYATESLDANRYTGQPIELDFKLTPAEDTNSES